MFLLSDNNYDKCFGHAAFRALRQIGEADLRYFTVFIPVGQNSR
jgi:hypothetical protein